MDQAYSERVDLDKIKIINKSKKKKTIFFIFITSACDKEKNLIIDFIAINCCHNNCNSYNSEYSSS